MEQRTDAELAPFATGGAWEWSSSQYQDASRRQARSTKPRAGKKDDGAAAGPRAKAAAESQFRLQYDKGDLPIRLDQGYGRVTSKRQVAWLVPIVELDLRHYLPILVDGLREARGARARASPPRALRLVRDREPAPRFPLRILARAARARPLASRAPVPISSRARRPRARARRSTSRTRSSPTPRSSRSSRSRAPRTACSRCCRCS